MSLRTLFRRRVRGVRLIELWAFGVAVVLELAVYLTKTGAGDEGQEIAKLERRIGKEQQTIRLLSAEVAYLEQPDRLAKLSAQLGLEALKGDRDIDVSELAAAAASGRAAPAAPDPAIAAVVAAPRTLGPEADTDPAPEPRPEPALALAALAEPPQ